ncbi:chemotaxis protein CheW [Roseimaritima sediminicola]|uniref:chemotaxis protein CheW n=1 Tax=Roseimaritima sediminicola TaxID=2662066 RepID=UPI0012985202|nr:chemotaxis protein CheW [Roseimaritima sediminicola]
MNAATSIAGVASARSVPPAAKHCVFSAGGNWYAMPATAVQEITVAPPLVAVPQCASVVIGMGHIRSQFVPVLAIDALLSAEPRPVTDPENRIIVLDVPHTWGIRIAEAPGIAALETLAIGGAAAEDHLAGLVLATAMYEDRIVNVLDPTTLYRHAETLLRRHWSAASTPPAESAMLQGAIN